MIEALIALVALSLMEIVLGIDNIVFISIMTAKLPVDQQSAARRLGLLLALVSRIILLSCIFWIAQLTAPVVTLSNWLPVEMLKSYFTDAPHGTYAGDGARDPNKGDNHDERGRDAIVEPNETFDQAAWDEFNYVSWRDLILMAGGLFLIYNSVREIHSEVEDGAHEQRASSKQIKFSHVLLQIAVMDVVFSLDSVITAVGMANQLWVMISAVVLAVAVMILFANQVGNFVDRHPTVRMLALNFLLLIGVMLLAEGVGTPINKGYIYFAMAFSLLIEAFNIRVRSKQSASD